MNELLFIDDLISEWDCSKIAIVDGDEKVYDYMSRNPHFKKTPCIVRLCSWLNIELEYVGQGYPFCIHGEYQPRDKWNMPFHFWRSKQLLNLKQKTIEEQWRHSSGL